MKQAITLIVGLIWFVIQIIVYRYVFIRNTKLSKDKFNILKFIEGILNVLVASAILWSSLFVPGYLPYFDNELYMGELSILSIATFFTWAFVIKKAFRKRK